MNMLTSRASGFFCRNSASFRTAIFQASLKTTTKFRINAPRFFDRNLANKRFFSSNLFKKLTQTTGTLFSGANTFPPKSKYPLNSRSSVGYWLIGTSGLVFGIVVLGGLTRLTESGLSITEWKPITGTIPPLNEEEWIAEFNKYKESPEFQQLNSHITLDEYKFIFFMEWAHRLWGRAIGAVLLLPAVYFAVRKRTSSHVNKRFVGLLALLALQGVLGWWMVYSGLDSKQLEERKSKPSVSQYRLTAHLGAAFLLYLGMFWTGLEILRENQWIKNPEAAARTFTKLNSPSIYPFRVLSVFLLGLTFATAMSGGMVAGLDAGLIYNTFPKMGDDWLPSKNELFSRHFSRKEDLSDLWWRNLFENPATVQLVHRCMAITTFTSVFVAHLYVNRNKLILPKRAVKLMHYAMGMVTLQAALGISTLIYLVPIPLAAAHQAGALGLLTICLAFAARLRPARTPIRQLIKKLTLKTKF